MHDSSVEDRLRTVLRVEADDLGLTISSAELERRLTARRQRRNGRRVSLLAAAIALVAVGAIAAMSNGWLRLPSIGGLVDPSPIATPGPSIEPLPSDPPSSSPAFVPPAMELTVSTLGVVSETLLLTTDCSFTYELADGSSGSGGCAENLDAEPVGATLDIPWGADLLFTFPDGWQFEQSLIDSREQSWVDDRPNASRAIAGWTSTGDQLLRINGTYGKDGDHFTASYVVKVHSPLFAPAVEDPSVPCGVPDLTVPSPPNVVLMSGETVVATGEFGTNTWLNSSTDSASDPMPTVAASVSAGAPLTLTIEGDVCAIGWRVEYGPRPILDYLSVERIGSLVIPHRSRPDDTVESFANRLDLAELPAGEWFIQAELTYQDGSAAMGWHIIVK